MPLAADGRQDDSARRPTNAATALGMNRRRDGISLCHHSFLLKRRRNSSRRLSYSSRNCYAPLPPLADVASLGRCLRPTHQRQGDGAAKEARQTRRGGE